MLTGGVLQGVIGEDEVMLVENLTGSFASALPGTWELTTNYAIVGIDAGNYALAQPTGLKGIIDPPPGLAGWALGYELFGEDADSLADPDHDGLSNAQEYAFGLNPTMAGDQPVVIVASSATGLTISYLQRSGVTYTVQATTDLTSWPAGSVTPPVSADQTNKISPDYTRYEATLSNLEGRGFMRVQAVVP